MAAARDAMLSEEEVAGAKKIFEVLDADGSGNLSFEEVTSALQQLKMHESDAKTKQLIAEVDLNNDGTVGWDEFLVVLTKAKESGGGGDFAKFVEESKKLIQVKGASGVHSYSEDEMAAFATHISQTLANVPECKHLLPVDPSGDDLCKKVGDGLLLAAFINAAVEGTIDMRAVNKPNAEGKMSLFKVNENQELVIASAKGIGISTVNLGARELVEGQKYPHMVLGLVWQLVKLQLLNSINLKNHPELVRLLEDGEELADLLRLPPEQLLLRWFNYHLKNAGHPKRVTNFGSDVRDSEAYTVLLHQISPGQCDTKALQEQDDKKRAAMVIDNANRVGAKSFVQPKDIASGNRRLNMAFTAAIFNACPGLDQLSEEELEKAGLMDDDVGDSREERAFRMWVNSQGIPDVYINNLFEDCRDGLAILRVMDRIEPGIVDWKKSVELKPNNRFKRVANCNYAIVLGKQLKFSLVGIGGVDITDGNKKLILALFWQLMRYHLIKFVAAVQAKRFGNRPVTDNDIISWANESVQAAGRSTEMKSFRDKSLSNSHFFMDLLFSVEKRIIDWDLVTEGATDEDKLLNARYAISVARKLGAVIFLLPEDVVEVRSKMILTFVASIMAVAK